MAARAPLDAPPTLASLGAGRPVALFLDFDGTLVDLAPRPDAIAVPSGLGARLGALAQRLEGRLALVSGRAIADLERYLDPLAVACAGSHGIARRLADGSALGAAPEALPGAARTDLQAFADAHGFLLEQKPHGAALHFRGKPELEPHGHAFAGNLAARHGLEVKRGNCVIELVRPGADKGAAVRAFMTVEPFTPARPVFVGDDLTDEDGFVAAAALGGIGILVGDRQPSVAAYRLADPAAVRGWLGL